MNSPNPSWLRSAKCLPPEIRARKKRLFFARPHDRLASKRKNQSSPSSIRKIRSFSPLASKRNPLDRLARFRKIRPFFASPHNPADPRYPFVFK
jgi:hypothetical protein